MEKLKRNKKFLLGFCALIVAVAMVSVGITLALEGTTPLPETNVLVIGNVDVDLNDVYEEKTLNPGTTGVQKEVSVTNKGSLPCYVRILVKKEWYKPGEYGVAGKSPVVSTANAATPTENQTFVKKDATHGLSVDMIAPSFSHASDWVKGDRVDGYDCYYYQTALAAGATTSTLMDTFGFLETADGVTFDKDTYAGYVGVISVKAQAVQSDWLEDYDGTKGQLEKSGGKIVGWKNITIQA